MSLAPRKKLYFDVIVTGVASSPASKIVALTPGFSAGAGKDVAGDRYGAFLDMLPALTGGSPVETKRRNAVAAWFECRGGGTDAASSEILGVDACLDFVSTLGEPIPFQKAGGGVNATFAGHDPVYAQQFGVRLRVEHSAFFTFGNVFKGILYVQRQHSLEI